VKGVLADEEKTCISLYERRYAEQTAKSHQNIVQTKRMIILAKALT